MRYITLGTAGHIDHGKSSLVKALTGTDPDRLKEEKERGITIDLGFANLDFPAEDLTVGIVDVPGHERLVRNMLAGAGGIDILMLVIAADEGVMPQSREHLQICELLKIKTGLIALNKADLAEPDWLELVTEEVREFVRGTFLEKAEIIPVSAKTGMNVGLLKEKIKGLALSAKSAKPAGGVFRLPVDRVFTLKGFGTVVTGTVLSGRVRVDEAVEVLPRKIETRVRGIHSHGRSMPEALAGQRAALNLQGVEKEDLQRGDVAVAPGTLRPSFVLDVHLELLKDSPEVKTGDVVHFHLATSETVARVILYGRELLRGGEASYGQMRLKGPVVAQSGDRFVIRRFSPLETIGGGSVLDPSPGRRRRKETLDDLAVYEAGSLKEKLAQKIMKSGMNGVARKELEGWIKAERGEIDSALKGLQKENAVVFMGDAALHASALASFREKSASVLRAFHKANPLKPGMPREELRAAFHMEPKLFAGLLQMSPDMAAEKDLVRLKNFQVALTGVDEGLKKRILDELNAAGMQPPFKDELAKKLSMEGKRLTDVLKLLAKEGLVVRMTDTLYLTRDSYEKMLRLLKEHFSKKPDMTVAEFRDMLGTTRKYALPMLEYLDSNKVTMRVGEIRKSLLKA